MEPTLAQSRSLRLDPDLLGVAQPWAVHDRGLERGGEVVFADSVDPELGRALPSGVGFRLMFFVVPRRPHPALIGDHRIAMAVPRRAPLEAQPAIARELRSIREARAQYGAASDPDSLAIQRSMRDQETSVRSELARRFRTSFAQGRIYAYGGERLSTSEVFVEDAPESWADRLVSAVLLKAYPDLPFDHSGFPHPLTDRMVEEVFRGLIQEQPDARTVAEGFGPGLGLSRPAESGLFDAGECPAIEIVRTELDSNDGAMLALDMLGQLGDVDGVTPALALLYLLAFIRAHRGELELVPGHRVEARNGDVFQGDRVTWDLVPEVSFSESLSSQLGMLRARPSVTGETVLPYLELIEGVVGKGPESAAEETRLRASLDRRPQVEALARFVDIPELGEPVGPDVPQRYEAVAGSLTSCAALGEEVSLDDAPYCATCRLALDEDIPRRETEALFGDTKRALQEYNRRLGSHAVRRVLADPTREQIDRFVKLVQVAGPSAQAGVLDDEVVAFLRSFVTSG